MYCGYITTIKNIRKHNNADRLQVATVFGSDVIVDMSYTTGKRVVYFPRDGQLGKEYAEENNLVRRKDENGKNVGGYLDPEKRNIKALKLRGEISDGMVLPIETLSKYTNIEELQDGDQITVLNGVEICRKYIPRGKPRRNTQRFTPKKNKKEEKEVISYPYFVEHEDTKQLAYNQSAFREGDIIYLTRKLHGTSFRVGNCVEITKKKRNRVLNRIFRLPDREKKRYKIVSGTRRVVLRDYEGGWYGSNAFRKKYNDFFAGKLPKGMTVYGEIVGWVDENTPIMHSCNNNKVDTAVNNHDFTTQYGEETVFTYGCAPGENACYIYRITMTNEDGIAVELPTEETAIWCERLGCEYVPLLEKFLYTSWEDLNNRVAVYLDIPEPLADGKHIAEGVVVRIDNRSKFTVFKAKGFCFKVLEDIIKDAADAPDMEEAEEILQEEAAEAAAE